MAKLTNEDKVAQQIMNSLDKLSLDLDKIGQIIAWSSSTVILNRLEVIVESAIEEKVKRYERDQLDYI